MAGIALPAIPLALVLLLAVACDNGNGDASGEPGAKQVHGRILEVVARNITEIETLRVRDDAGREWTFTTEGFAGFTPSHLREHQLFGQSVVVSYLEMGDRLVAIDLFDWEPALQ